MIYLLNQTVHPEGEVKKSMKRPSVGNQSLSCQDGGTRNGGKRQKLVLAAGAEPTGNVSEHVQCCLKSLPATTWKWKLHKAVLSNRHQKVLATHWSGFEALVKVLTSLDHIIR